MDIFVHDINTFGILIFWIIDWSFDDHKLLKDVSELNIIVVIQWLSISIIVFHCLLTATWHLISLLIDTMSLDTTVLERICVSV